MPPHNRRLAIRLTVNSAMCGYPSQPKRYCPATIKELGFFIPFYKFFRASGETWVFGHTFTLKV
jgi:hypothetical protein